LARSRNVPRPQAARPGFRDVEPLAVGRQADAVRSVGGKDHLADHRAVRLRVVDARTVTIALAVLAVIREPEAAGGVEHDVVRAAQPVTVALGVEHLHFAGVDVDALDAPAAVVLRLQARHGEAADLVPFEAAIVAD